MVLSYLTLYKFYFIYWSISLWFVKILIFHSFLLAMYNGIGLKTARGSGTNGFVQRNLSYVSPIRLLEFSKRRDNEIAEPKIQKQDTSILEHQVKREIELAVLELEEKMKEQGYAIYPFDLTA